EIERQIAAYETQDESQFPQQETRLFDVDSGVTRVMRKKEGEADYRYFAEPDLPFVTADEVLLERQRSMLPELPGERRARYTEKLGLSAYDAGVLVASRPVADFFETVVRLCKRPKEAANWISNEILRALSGDEVEASSIDDLPLKPNDLAELLGLIEEGRLSSAGAKKVIRDMMVQGRSAKDTMEALGQEQNSDPGQVEAWCKEALVGKDAVVEEIRAGKEKAIGALVGAVMKASKGSADPKLVQETLRRLIAGS
ncbi:MAG: Asp-tRNA(Asn)/Glu-tRNA(Gln) amidotransferase GatCAB subunit B, partial [Planctomycetota bacterium]